MALQLNQHSWQAEVGAPDARDAIGSSGKTVPISADMSFQRAGRSGRRDTEDAARTGRDATVQDQMGRNAAEAARQNEVYDQAVGTHADLTLSPRANNALRSSMVTPKVTRTIPIDVAHLNYINTEEVACQGIRNVRQAARVQGRHLSQ